MMNENTENPLPAEEEPEINEIEDTRPRKAIPPAGPTGPVQPEAAAGELEQPVSVTGALIEQSPGVEEPTTAYTRPTLAIPEAGEQAQVPEPGTMASPESAIPEELATAYTRPTPVVTDPRLGADRLFDATIPPPGWTPADPSIPSNAPAMGNRPIGESTAARRPSRTGGKSPAGSRGGGKPPVSRISKSSRRGAPWFLLPLLGVIALVLVAAGAAAAGYAGGISQRRDAEVTQQAASALEQFQLGLEDMANNRYYQARQRFEYVIQLDPNFPDAANKLAETLLYLNATATVTPQPTATLTPTPDMRAVEELYNQAQTALQNSEWDAAITALLALRGKDINYRVVDVDGMLFLALRNRGRQKIVNADMEGGIYDLTLAANFAPLDAEAQGLLTWSEMYLTGASFWGIDWAQVVDYFSQVAPQMPNLTDSSGMTASARLRIALYEYGNTLAAQGKYCQAVEMYNQSLAAGGADGLDAALQAAAQACEGASGGGTPGAQETPKPGKKKTPTP